MATDRAKRKVRGGSIDMAWELEVRQKIQTSQVCNRLINFVKGEISLKPAQVTAALGLLRKVLPDLASTEIKGQVEHSYVAEVPPVLESSEEWERKYGNPTVAH